MIWKWLVPPLPFGAGMRDLSHAALCNPVVPFRWLRTRAAMQRTGRRAVVGAPPGCGFLGRGWRRGVPRALGQQLDQCSITCAARLAIGFLPWRRPVGGQMGIGSLSVSRRCRARRKRDAAALCAGGDALHALRRSRVAPIHRYQECRGAGPGVEKGQG
ncbi:MAG: hypothetical protein J3K34DRAFT_398868 [Monoraphidium minutum]|nr:MAG: hypothetical protein J3K34DRAFT_398868 [Monoraphidium minutum]